MISQERLRGSCTAQAGRSSVLATDGQTVQGYPRAQASPGIAWYRRESPGYCCRAFASNSARRLQAQSKRRAWVIKGLARELSSPNPRGREGRGAAEPVHAGSRMPRQSKPAASPRTQPRSGSALVADTFAHLVGAIAAAHLELASHAGRAVNRALTLRNWLIG